MFSFLGMSTNPFEFLEDGAYKIADSVMVGVSSEAFQFIRDIVIGLVVISLLIDTIRFGIKKEYTAIERKGWYWPDLVFKSLLIVVVNNFPYLYGLLYSIMQKMRL